MPSGQRSRLQNALLIAGIVLIGINLRPALAGVGPLVADIRQAMGLSNAAFGLLTTLPLLAFGIFSTLTSLLTRRIGIERTLALALVLLTAGILIRIAPSVVLLYGGTLILGIGIALGNVLLPSLVKRDFPNHAGLMTSVYSSTMGLGATVGAGLSVPLAQGLGWRGSLAVWALPAAVALVVWLPQLRERTLARHARNLRQSLRGLGGSRLAWSVAVFMGLQSLTFYVVLAWLPDILQGRGMPPDEAGWMLALSQGAGIAGTVLTPILAERWDDQRSIVWTLVMVEVASLIGLIYGSEHLTALWVAAIGLILGGSFGLALLFIVLRTTSLETATELSGMSQSVGYLLASLGPTLFGWLHDATAAWIVPIYFLVAVAVVKLVAGLVAGRPQTIRN